MPTPPPFTKMLRPDGIPRRNDITLLTDEEKRLSDVHQMIEVMGAHPLLTEAGTLILQAKDKLADYLESEVLGN